MSAKPLAHAIADAVVTDWRVSNLSQQGIAEKYKISKGAVNKLCRGVERDARTIVTDGIKYNQALMAHDDRIVTAIETAVEVAVKRQEWLNIQALKNVKQSMEAKCEGQMDYQRRADTILKAKETVIGKTPDTAIQINNSSAIGYVVSPGKASSMEEWAHETALSKTAEDE